MSQSRRAREPLKHSTSYRNRDARVNPKVEPSAEIPSIPSDPRKPLFETQELFLMGGKEDFSAADPEVLLPAEDVNKKNISVII